MVRNCWIIGICWILKELVGVYLNLVGSKKEYWNLFEFIGVGWDISWLEFVKKCWKLLESV